MSATAGADEQQRYRAYAAQDVNTLNADQRAALVALPALEGAYKELEDLVRDKGPVEVGSAVPTVSVG